MPPLNVLDDNAVHDIGNVVEPIDDLFQMIVDLVADVELEPASSDIGLIPGLQAELVQVVSLSCEFRDLFGQ